jgi:hypothetical protein
MRKAVKEEVSETEEELRQMEYLKITGLRQLIMQSQA